MEFHVKNSYIKGFLSKFKGQNELKVLKYISIIGINHLLTAKKEIASFSDIKKLAKTITKTSAKEDKKIKTELRVIKDELSKLNEKFEEKMKAFANKKSEGNLRVATEENYTSLASIISSPKTNYHDIEKRRNLTSEIKRHEKGFSEKKANDSHEKINEIVKSRHSITPKPTEISFPVMNPGRNKNTVTRHHLDDSQTKALFKEEGVVYFPPGKDSAKRDSQATVSQTNETIEKPKLNANLPKYPVPKSKYEDNIEYPERDVEPENSNNPTVSSHESQPSTKSPQFAKSKDEIINRINDQINREDKENRNLTSPNIKSNNTKNKDNEKEQVKNRGSTKAPTLIEETKKMEKKILRDKSRRKNEIGRPANTLNLNEIESKIRDKVIKDKVSAKENLRNNQSNNDNYMSENAARKPEKFSLVENPNYVVQKSTENYYKNKYENPKEESKLLESTISVGHKSINLPNYSGGYANLTPPQISTSRREAFNTSRPEESERRYGEENANDNYLGMLDIANSFLNSPLMNQLSGFEKSSGISLKDSYHQGMKKNFSNSRVGTFEVKSSRDRKSPYYSEPDDHRYQDDNRYQDSINYQKYQEFQPAYRPDFGKSNSYLKESGNRRPYGEPTKESRIFNREENSSLASSNFSNFLNDEMKGFYQKETLEANQPKYRKEQRPNSGENSSNISFNGNDTSHPEEQTMIGRKSAQMTGLDISKNYTSYDRNNVFKQERMSVSRVLNN